MFPYAYILKYKFQLKEEGIEITHLAGFRFRCSSRLCKIFYLNNKCTPTISERYHQRSMLPTLWTTSWATKRSSYVNICIAEENNFKEELYLHHYSIIVL